MPAAQTTELLREGKLPLPRRGYFWGATREQPDRVVNLLDAMRARPTGATAACILANRDEQGNGINQ